MTGPTPVNKLRYYVNQESYLIKEDGRNLPRIGEQEGGIELKATEDASRRDERFPVRRSGKTRERRMGTLA